MHTLPYIICIDHRPTSYLYDFGGLKWTFGTNGFHLKFADNSGTTATTLGKDSSGNGNNFTPNNFSVSNGNGNDLLRYCDVIVTARGTSAIEYASLGKKVITCFDSPFTKLGFTSHANTKDEYSYLLNNIDNIKKLTEDQKNLALIFAASFLADMKNKNYLEFPFGTGGNLLYLDFVNFIRNNKKQIDSETNILKKWLSSGFTRYNTFKFLNDI